LAADGAEIVPFDTLHDKQLPQVDALFIGGGFPEVFAAELAANMAMRREIRNAIESGMPVYAECGGLMYLTRSIEYQGQSHEMVGIIPGDTVMHDKPVGRGYVNLQEESQHPWPQIEVQSKTIKAHEFHYSSLENLPLNSTFAYRVTRGHGINGQADGYLYKNLLANYTHQRNVGSGLWTTRFIAFIRQVKQREQTSLLLASL
jgi:cobyrinic acid a,c-diamide synthase